MWAHMQDLFHQYPIPPEESAATPNHRAQYENLTLFQEDFTPHFNQSPIIHYTCTRCDVGGVWQRTDGAPICWFCEKGDSLKT